MTTVIAPVPGATGASMKPDGTKLRAVNATIDRTVRILRTEGSPNPSPVQSKLIPDRLADNSAMEFVQRTLVVVSPARMSMTFASRRRRHIALRTFCPPLYL
jgi:hypothetical protein